VTDLNLRARALMRASGHLGPDALRVGEREFATGDHVVTLKNARHLGVVNGTRGVVMDVNRDAAELVVRMSDGRDVRLPGSYLESQTERGGRTLDYGYAITGHKGMTTGRAFVLGTDDLYREWATVAMSRGSLEAAEAVAPHLDARARVSAFFSRCSLGLIPGHASTRSIVTLPCPKRSPRIGARRPSTQPCMLS
jgi:hypothetical protein